MESAGVDCGWKMSGTADGPELAATAAAHSGTMASAMSALSHLFPAIRTPLACSDCRILARPSAGTLSRRTEVAFLS